MSKTLMFEIADEVRSALQEIAAKTGRPLEELALEWLMKYRPKQRPVLSETQRRTALDQLRRHAGAASIGRPTGADNETIDTDLAGEYGETHEE